MTSLHRRRSVYLLAWTGHLYRKFEMSLFKYFTKIDMVKHVQAIGSLLSECSVGNQSEDVPKLNVLVHLVGKPQRVKDTAGLLSECSVGTIAKTAQRADPGRGASVVK